MNPGLFLREMPSRAPRNGTHDEAILRFKKKKKKKSVVFCLWKNKNHILRAFVLDERKEERDDEESVERRKSRERIRTARGFDVATRVFDHY